MCKSNDVKLEYFEIEEVYNEYIRDLVSDGFEDN